MIEVELILRLVISVTLGLMVGVERELSHKPAGLRTHILVCLGATLATIVSTYYYQVDPARIAAAIMTGIGFIGAGTIIASGTKGVHGLTTAATIWTTAAIGIAVGIGVYSLSVLTTILVVTVLTVAGIGKKRIKKLS